MKVEFLRDHTQVTKARHRHTAFRKGGRYDLSEDQAEEFVKQGLATRAEEVSRTTPRTGARATSRAKAGAEE